MYIEEEDHIDDNGTVLKTHKFRNKTRKFIHIHVATITSVVGVKGAIKIKTFTEHPSDLLGFDSLYILKLPTDEEKEKRGYTPGAEKKEEIKLSLQSSKKECIIATIEGINTREEARNLINTELYISRLSLGENSEDEYFHADLIGLNVTNENGINVGIVRNVMNFGAGDILEIYDEMTNKSFLHPFSKEFVPTIQIPRGTMRIISIDVINESD